MADECSSYYSINSLKTSLQSHISLNKPNLHSSNIAILDSGCTGNYLRTDAPVVDRDFSSHPITAGTPNGSVITSSCSARLPDVHIPPSARKATIFPDLTYRSLLSVGVFADAGYEC